MVLGRLILPKGLHNGSFLSHLFVSHLVCYLGSKMLTAPLFSCQPIVDIDCVLAIGFCLDIEHCYSMAKTGSADGFQLVSLLRLAEICMYDAEHIHNPTHRLPKTSISTQIKAGKRDIENLLSFTLDLHKTRIL